MAGLGRKDFQAGAVLSAADVDGYLMDQSVMKFANTAAAGSAYGTAIAEGMQFYLSDTDEVVFHNGTSFAKQKPSRNALINANFAINQRGFTSTTTTGTYGFDRFYLRTGGNGTATYSAQTFTPGDRPAGADESANYARLVTSGFTDQTSLVGLGQNIEGVRTFAGKTVTMSFWARAASGTPKVGGQVFQGFGSGGSSAVNVDFGYVTINTTWTRYSLTATLPELTGKTIGSQDFIGQRLYTAVGTSVTGPVPAIGLQNTSVDFWGIQLEVGSAATPFATATETIQGELAACQRYYQRLVTGGNANVYFGYGWTVTSSAANCFFPTKVTMRVTPTSSEVGGNLLIQDTTNATFGATSASINTAQSNPDLVALSIGMSGATAGRSVQWGSNANASSYFAVSAEL